MNSTHIFWIAMDLFLVSMLIWFQPMYFQMYSYFIVTLYVDLWALEIQRVLQPTILKR